MPGRRVSVVAPNGAPTAKPTVSMRPTTAVPTPKPTVSVAPTRSCACEQALTVTVVTDNYPGETAWSLVSPARIS